MWILKELQGSTLQERIPAMKNQTRTWRSLARKKMMSCLKPSAEKWRSRNPTGSRPFSTDLLENILVSKEAVSNQLSEVNTRKASGPDGRSPNLLKHLAEDHKSPLTEIFRQCLQPRVWPIQWNEARIISVHKKRSRSDLDNYMPISLLSAVIKIFKRVIAEHLTVFLDENHLISSKQYGFRRGFLLQLSQSWHKAWTSFFLLWHSLRHCWSLWLCVVPGCTGQTTTAGSHWKLYEPAFQLSDRQKSMGCSEWMHLNQSPSWGFCSTEMFLQLYCVTYILSPQQMPTLTTEPSRRHNRGSRPRTW